MTPILLYDSCKATLSFRAFVILYSQHRQFNLQIYSIIKTTDTMLITFITDMTAPIKLGQTQKINPLLERSNQN